MPVNGGEFVWRPVRRRFGISAFGSNAYSAEKAGQRVIEEHFERDGHEEMYVVLRGRATFTLGDDELDAGPGHARLRPARARGAARSRRRTTRSCSPSARSPASSSSRRRGRTSSPRTRTPSRASSTAARELVQEAIERSPDAWQGYYNSACIEARFGDPDDGDRAAEALGRARRRGDEEGRRRATATSTRSATGRTTPRKRAARRTAPPAARVLLQRLGELDQDLRLLGRERLARLRAAPASGTASSFLPRSFAVLRLRRLVELVVEALRHVRASC